MTTENSAILVFKTNLSSPECIDKIRTVLDQDPDILQWNVDGQDKDFVLRIVAIPTLRSQAIIARIERAGYYCEELD
ncbi:MAG TPA: hypothetical protein VHK91_07540 [Flavisolibacter sp.]|nr:hypothetical protein [Flavisolibacter sp.]